jgi:hypothetical protein
MRILGDGCRNLPMIDTTARSKRKITGGRGGTQAIELVAAVGPGRACVRQDTDDEPRSTGMEATTRVGPLLHVGGRAQMEALYAPRFETKVTLEMKRVSEPIRSP